MKLGETSFLYRIKPNGATLERVKRQVREKSRFF